MVTLSNPLDYHTFVWGDRTRQAKAFSSVMRGGYGINLVVLDFPRADRCDATDWTTTVDAVIERMLWTHRRHGVDGWLLDPWNEMDHSRPNGMTMTEYCNNELRKIKRVLQNHDVWGGLIAHPTKLYRQKSDGKYPVPTLYDIADSAAFFNKADNGIVLVRDKDDDGQPVQVHVQKVRFAEIGGLGMQPFGYDRATGRYTDVPADLPQNGGW